MHDVDHMSTCHPFQVMLTAIFLFVRRLKIYVPCVLFVGHKQKVHTQIRRRVHAFTRRLIRVFTVCLHNILLEIERKMKNTIQQPLSQKRAGPIEKDRKVRSA